MATECGEVMMSSAIYHEPNETIATVAKTMAEKFDRSEYVGDAAFAYWWGHNKGAPELYRYVMRAS